MPRMADLLSLDEALARVLERVRPLPAERVPLEAAAGRVLAEPARALVDLPPFPSSAMDGFAFRIGDAPNGYVHWTLATGGKTLVDATSTGVDTWLGDRVRPKWGIYRSVDDTSGSLHDCYLLLANMRAYRKQ